jgi:bifunctional non-homologous end joining protein LigD
MLNEGDHMAQDKLDSYRRKRNFAVTSEPATTKAGKMSSAEGIFVVQKHDASRLHYDLRLEVGGVLKSFAVPKGPSRNPKDKRLAVETEDHPRDYANFEGIIPEGQYGAGAVIVWDTGSYRNITERDGRAVPVAEALKAGHAAIWLDGKKLQGGYALTRTKMGWILVKIRDEKAESSHDVLESEPRSVISGMTIEELWKKEKREG